MIWHFPNGSSVRTEGLQESRSVGHESVVTLSANTLHDRDKRQSAYLTPDCSSSALLGLPRGAILR
jgi:hypothetical protein